jgi:hypothetical protein
MSNPDIEDAAEAEELPIIPPQNPVLGHQIYSARVCIDNLVYGASSPGSAFCISPMWVQAANPPHPAPPTQLSYGQGISISIPELNVSYTFTATTAAKCEAYCQFNSLSSLAETIRSTSQAMLNSEILDDAIVIRSVDGYDISVADVNPPPGAVGMVEALGLYPDNGMDVE